MRTLLALALLLAGCASAPHAMIRTPIEDRMRIDGLSGERVQLLNEGPGPLVFELQREKGPGQQVKIAEGMAWDFPLEGLRSIVVEHKGEGQGHLRITVSGSHGGSIRALPLPKE